MATGDKAEMRAALEIALGDAAGSEWTDPEKDNAIDEAVDDVTRLMPRERINETVYRITTTDETFTSSHNTFVALDNKPIKKGSTVVTNSAGTTTYDEYDDYEMDYANSQIKVLSTGDMANSTAFKIDYTIDVPSIDVSGITDLMVPLRVEWPIDNVPKSFASFMHFEDQLILTTKGTRGQTSIGDKDHVRLYYFAEHTPPTASAAGTYPRWLDSIVVKGALAYCLFIKARKLYLKAEDQADEAQTQLAKQDDNVSGGITTAFGDANTAFDLVGTTLGAISGTALEAALGLIRGADGKPLDDAITTLAAVRPGLTNDAIAALNAMRGTSGRPLDDAITALNLVSTYSQHATQQVESQRPRRGDISSAATANSGRSTTFTTSADHALETGDIVNIESTTDYNGKWVVTKLSLTTFQIYRNFASDQTGHFHRESQIHEASETLEKMPAELLLINTALDKITTELESETSGDRSADFYLNAGDELINTINAGLNPAELYMNYAQIKVQIAQTLGQEAQGRMQHAAGLANEVSARLEVVQRVLEAANTSLGVSGSYISEAQTRVAHANTLVSEGQTRISIANTVIAEAQVRLTHAQVLALEAQTRINYIQAQVSEAQIYLGEGMQRLATVQQYVLLSEMHIAGGQAYIELARQFSEEADRFLTDARERHRDYIRHLTARVEQARPRSHSASRQWSDSANNRITAPTGSEV